MLTFFMFNLIIYITVNVEVLADTEVITHVFILKLKYFNTLEFFSEIIWVESLSVFMIFMGGYTI